MVKNLEVYKDHQNKRIFTHGVKNGKSNYLDPIT